MNSVRLMGPVVGEKVVNVTEGMATAKAPLAPVPRDPVPRDPVPRDPVPRAPVPGLNRPGLARPGFIGTGTPRGGTVLGKPGVSLEENSDPPKPREGTEEGLLTSLPGTKGGMGDKPEGGAPVAGAAPIAPTAPPTAAPSGTGKGIVPGILFELSMGAGLFPGGNSPGKGGIPLDGPKPVGGGRGGTPKGSGFEPGMLLFWVGNSVPGNGGNPPGKASCGLPNGGGVPNGGGKPVVGAGFSDPGTEGIPPGRVTFELV